MSNQKKAEQRYFDNTVRAEQQLGQHEPRHEESKVAEPSEVVTIDPQVSEVDQQKLVDTPDDSSDSSLQQQIQKDYPREELKMSNMSKRDVYLSEEMNCYFYNKNQNLHMKEIDGDQTIDSYVIPLKLHLQKIITLPTTQANVVYLIGGAKDEKAITTVNSCYKLPSAGTVLESVDKLPEAKCSFAACISLTCEKIFTAGGNRGNNTVTNSSEMFNVDTGKWTKLGELNCPRMSAGMVECTNSNLYVFSGIDNNPDDPTRFVTLKSIEHLNYANLKNEWEVLKVKVPFKTSSPGAI